MWCGDRSSVVMTVERFEIYEVPVLWSPWFERSKEELAYEKPTPAGESRNIIFATVK